jgi:hypothetical protein
MRGIRIRALLAVAALGGVVAVTAAPAQAATPAQLLVHYQPVTVLDPLEPFAPTSVNGFVADSTLQVQTAPGTWALADADPSLGGLPVTPTQTCSDLGIGDCYRLNQQPCSPAGGTAGVTCYRDAWLAHATPSVVYGRVAYRPRRIVVQYWYFYYDDLYSYDYPPDDLFWQAHEGDWEVVSVVLDRRTQRPLQAAYSQHCTGERRGWSDLDRIGTHPIDHVAIGSHANLLDAGSHPVATACIPPAALQILQANGLPAPVDRSGAGRAFGPSSIASVTATEIRRIDRRRTPWVAFAGTWGEDQVFHAPAPIGTVTLGTSPMSPAYAALWKTPLAVIGHWPQG